jgi:hypothetical protein
MNDRKQQLLAANAARLMDTAEHAVADALVLDYLEGSQPEMKTLAESVGVGRPGDPDDHTQRFQGHPDVPRSTLPQLAGKALEFQAPLELVEGGRCHGWLDGGINTRMPGWTWRAEHLDAVELPAWPLFFDWLRKLRRDQTVGFNAASDGLVAAAKADSLGMLHLLDADERVALYSGERSRTAIERSLLRLEERGYATITRTVERTDSGKKKQLWTIRFQLPASGRSTHAAGNGSVEAAPAPAGADSPETAAPAEVWDFTSGAEHTPEPAAEPEQTEPAAEPEQTEPVEAAQQDTDEGRLAARRATALERIRATLKRCREHNEIGEHSEALELFEQRIGANIALAAELLFGGDVEQAERSLRNAFRYWADDFERAA